MLREKYDVVIVGGGPTGMMSALSADYYCRENRNSPLSILIVEKRGVERTRSNTLLLDEAPVSALQRLGCNISSLTPAADFTQIFPDHGVMNQYPLAEYRLKKPRRSLSFNAFFMLRRKPVFNVSINELERILLEKLSRLGNVNIEFDTQLASIECNKNSVQLKVCTNHFVKKVVAKYVIAADGTHSETLRRLGLVHDKGEEKLETVISANFSQPGRGNTKYQTMDRSFEALSLASKQGTSVFVKIDEGSAYNNLSLDVPAERERLVCLLKNGARKLGVYSDIGVGLSILEVTVRQAQCSVYKNRIIIAGDARHSGTPRVGLGVNVALMDAIRAAKAIESSIFGNGLGRRLALANYSAHTWLGTLLFSILSKSTKAKPQHRESSLSGRGSSWNFWKGQLLMSFHWRAGKGRSWHYIDETPQESFKQIRLGP